MGGVALKYERPLDPPPSHTSWRHESNHTPLVRLGPLELTLCRETAASRPMMGHSRGVWLCLALVPSFTLDCGPTAEDERRPGVQRAERGVCGR